MVAVSIRQLDKRFGDTTVLQDVNLHIDDGAFAVLVGPSGCGKSTLLRLIAGLDKPSAGRIVFGERDVTSAPPRERDVAMVFQSYALYPHLSVHDNLAFGLRLRKIPKKEIAARIAEVSDMLGLAPLLERMPRALSGGQRQRVAMGRAIARRPALFLFDEPLSNLDAALRAQVRVDIRKLHQRFGTTSIYVTHDQVEAMTLADQMFILNGGRIQQSGPPLTLYDQPNSRFVAGFLGSPATNFLRGTLRRHGDHWTVTLGDNSVGNDHGDDDTATATPLLVGGPDDDSRLAAHDGQAVVVGIRPHHLTLKADGPIALTLDLVEELGGETYAYGTLHHQPVVARLKRRLAHDGDHPILHLDAQPQHIKLFHTDTGIRL
ncbi:MAG TPA: sn-glycerol-3-phosphate ABC transporter ATP-binding protein UgpC [Sorangium sp.]|nr:sn-glycerol-3-phosphate ABC transporter ATP-binding protein UgpC [Sorangium sp.]